MKLSFLSLVSLLNANSLFFVEDRKELENIAAAWRPRALSVMSNNESGM